MDFESQYRNDVKNYIFKRFGKLHTCSVGAYGRLKLKAGLKDFGRAKGISFEAMNSISKDIDQELTYTWRDFVIYAINSKANQKSKDSSGLYDFMQKYPDIAHCIKYSLNQARSASIHASAVVIVPKQDKNGQDINIFEWMPIREVEVDGKKVYVAEWEGLYCDKAGFLKEDILALAQLDKFHMTKDLIKRNLGIEIVLEDLPMDDVDTFKLFKRGLNEDVFQFGSSGLKNYSIQVKPDTLEDLTAMNALYRPGPMKSNAHIDFGLIKHGKKKPEYDYGLRSVTEKTNGLWVFQEQIMQAVVVLGGFTLAQADDTRSHIKKFDKVAMKLGKDKFVAGAIERGCPELQAPKIWDKLVAFSAYGFNKCASGDTLIYRFTGNQHLPKEITIKQLFDLSTIPSTSIFDKFIKQGHLGLVRYYNHELDKVQYAKVKAVHYNGKREVFEVRLANGYKIKCTENHKLLTKSGYKQIKELKRGEILICCGEKIMDYDKSYKPTGLGRWQSKSRIIDGKFIEFRYAKDNALIRSKGNCENCSKPAFGRMEFHHKDGDNKNHDYDNVVYVCNSCHKYLDYELGLKNGNRDQGFYAIRSKIVYIKYLGIEEVYDLEMFEEPHNFIANGIVSHNSHSNSYSHMSYYCQYLKVKYPLEFWTTSLNFAKEDHVPKRISELKKLKQDLKIKPPSINKSTKIFDCDHETQTIYWSLSKIKGFGGEGATVDYILAERNLNGAFKDYNDFVKRFPNKITKANILVLIVCGAFDEIEHIEKEIDRFKLIKRHYERINKLNEPKTPVEKRKRVWEPEPIPETYTVLDSKKNYYWILLQRNLTGYGDVDYRSILLTHTLQPLGKKLSNLFVSGEQLEKSKDYEEVAVAGLVIYADVRTTKKKEKYIILNMISNNDLIFLLFWPDSYDKFKEILDDCKNKTYAMSGKVKMDDYRGQKVVFGNEDSKILEL